jgi:hypothetical protein
MLLVPTGIHQKDCGHTKYKRSSGLWGSIIMISMAKTLLLTQMKTLHITKSFWNHVFRQSQPGQLMRFFESIGGPMLKVVGVLKQEWWHGFEQSLQVA